MKQRNRILILVFAIVISSKFLFATISSTLTGNDLNLCKGQEKEYTLSFKESAPAIARLSPTLVF